MADANSAQEIIRNALILTGTIADEEDPSASQAQDGLNRLNDMLDMWSIDRLTIPSILRSVFPFGSTQSYTMGPSGDFDQTYSPAKIEEAYCQVTSTSPASEVPMQIVEAQVWSEITVKTTQSSIPREVWVQYGYPLATLSFFPIPQAVNNVVLYQWAQLDRSSGLSSDLIFPKGYRMAMIYNLAKYLAPFHGRKLNEDLLMLAEESKTVISRYNLPEHLMECDLGTLSPSKTFNWLTGEAR